jgi:hypothetical protein
MNRRCTLLILDCDEAWRILDSEATRISEILFCRRETKEEEDGGILVLHTRDERRRYFESSDDTSKVLKEAARKEL